MPDNTKDPHNSAHDIAQWAEQTIFNEYPWHVDQQHEAALSALKSAVITTDHYSQFFRQFDILDAERKSIDKHTLLQRRNDLADFFMNLYSQPPLDQSSFNTASVHADRISILNGITAQHWLKALQQWEQEYPDEPSRHHKPVVSWFGDQSHDRFMISVRHTTSIEDHQPDFITLTAYTASTFQSEHSPGFAAGTAIVPWSH